MRRILSWLNLAAVVANVVKHSLRGRLCLERSASCCFSSTQGVSCFDGLHFAEAGCLGIARGNARGGGSSPAVCRSLAVVLDFLIDNRDSLAILVLCKATIYFLFPRRKRRGRASQCAQNSKIPSISSLIFSGSAPI